MNITTLILFIIAQKLWKQLVKKIQKSNIILESHLDVTRSQVNDADVIILSQFKEYSIDNKIQSFIKSNVIKLVA